MIYNIFISLCLNLILLIIAKNITPKIISLLHIDYAQYNTYTYSNYFFIVTIYIIFWTLLLSIVPYTYAKLYIILITTTLLSYTDLLYFIIDPTIFYSGVILSFLFYHCSEASWGNIILLPLMMYLFFTLWNYILPNSFGLGDSKLLIYWSCFFPLTMICWIIVWATIYVYIFVLIQSILNNKKITIIPFVPFLSLALFTMLLTL